MSSHCLQKGMDTQSDRLAILMESWKGSLSNNPSSDDLKEASKCLVQQLPPLAMKTFWKGVNEAKHFDAIPY